MLKNYREKSWSDSRIEVRLSQIQGKAGFAREAIRKDEIVVVLGGTVMTDREFRTYTASTTTAYDAIQIDEDLHLVDLSPDPRTTNGALNHHCDSSLWMADEVTLVARRDIAAGEEVTIDYALFTALPDWVLDLPCRCGSSVCRHTITGSDWKRPDVQARYRDHFSPFINARIARLKTP